MSADKPEAGRPCICDDEVPPRPSSCSEPAVAGKSYCKRCLHRDCEHHWNPAPRQPAEQPSVSEDRVAEIASEVRAAYREAEAETRAMAAELNARDERRADEQPASAADEVPADIDWARFLPTEEVPSDGDHDGGPAWRALVPGDVFVSAKTWAGNTAGVATSVWQKTAWGRYSQQGEAKSLGAGSHPNWYHRAHVRVIRHADGRWADGYGPDGPIVTPAPAQGAPAEPLSAEGCDDIYCMGNCRQCEARRYDAPSLREEMHKRINELETKLAVAERERDEAVKEAGDWAARASLARSEERDRCLYHVETYEPRRDVPADWTYQGALSRVAEAIRDGRPAK